MNKKREDFHNLFFKIPKTLLKEFNTEIVLKYGKTYGNMTNAIIEAIDYWVNAQKKERKEKKTEAI